VRSEAPFGVLVVVYRQRRSQHEYLVLHRTDLGPEYAGDWAWRPPGGSREPDETSEECARRELHEETGLDLTVCRVRHADQDWAVYTAQAPVDAPIILSSEHDRWRWLPAAEALALRSPQIIVAELVSAVQAL
jgi:8-oxo-dGTP pyrophosphatase MutT (NUDIX family)